LANLTKATDVEDLDALVRRVDLDRWLATRFIADRQARADVIALYAFDHELSRVARVTSQPLVGEMRLTWWSEAIAEIFDGKPVRKHPVLLALSEAISRHTLPRQPFDALIDARLPEVDGGDPDEGAIALNGMRLAAHILGSEEADFGAAAFAWAAYMPATLAKANQDLAELPSAAFPAVAYVTLVRAEKPDSLTKRLRIAWAVLRGRVLRPVTVGGNRRNVDCAGIPCA
jgi:phytoene synthase